MASSFTGLTNQFTTLTQNTSSANQTLAGTLINQQYKYLLQRYFDNEKQTTIQTIGPQTLTITNAALPASSTSATLTANWTYPSCQQLVVFSDSEQRTVYFIQNSTAISWQVPTTAVQTSASISCVGVQSYPLPANVSKVKNDTITIGQLVYTPAPVNSIQEWTKLNALPYTAAYPAYFFMYDNHLNFWPIPSTTGYIITIYCQVTVPDMTYTDYTSPGTISTMTINSNLVTGSGTTWNTTGNYPTGVDLGFANIYLTALPPLGDGLLYQIQSITDDTDLVLFKPVVNASTFTGASLLIGQYPLLNGDFDDAIVYGALRIYFMSIVPDPNRYQLYNGLYQEKLEAMRFYLSTKSVNVDLGTQPMQSNPNLFLFPTNANQ